MEAKRCRGTKKKKKKKKKKQKKNTNPKNNPKNHARKNQNKTKKTTPNTAVFGGRGVRGGGRRDRRGGVGVWEYGCGGD